MYNWSQASSFNKPILSPNRRGRGPGRGICTIPEHHQSERKISGRLPAQDAAQARGGDTKVIITEYDLPRSDAEPHDAAVDRKGLVWYCDYAEGIIGRLDPRSGETKEWLNPKGRAGYPGGYQSLELDKDDNPGAAITINCRPHMVDA